MALTEQKKQKKAKQKKQKRNAQAQSNSSQLLLDKITPFLEHPFYECLMPNNLFEAGIGNILITRLSPKGEVAVASFIVDVYCLGVKKALFKTMPLPEYEKVFKPGILESHGDYPFTKLKPACALKLITGVVQYSKELGFNSHKDYHSLKSIFGEQKLGICWSNQQLMQII